MLNVNIKLGIFLACLIAIPLQMMAQKGGFEISGVVKNQRGETIPGANVTEKGTVNGTITNGDGIFNLKMTDRNNSLVVSFMGFQKKELAPAEGGFVTVILEEENKEIDEVVIVGYGEMKKSDLTGSVVSVRTSDMKGTPASSVDHLLQGRAAGVVLTQNSGAPGAGTSIRIRGGNSIEGNNEPLYVIDGFPIYNNSSDLSPEDGSSMDLSGGSNPLAMLNPNDIKSIQILKDASATAIYGSRGANGVIIITTKRGEAGRSEVTINFNSSLQKVSRKMPMLGARDFAILSNEAYKEAGYAQLYLGTYKIGDYLLPSYKDLDENSGTDWQDEIFRLAPLYNFNVSVSGGSKGTKYLFSTNLYNQDGILIGSSYMKGNIRLNLDQRISDKVAFGANINMTRYVNSQVPTASNSTDASGAVVNALIYNPVYPAYDENGDYFTINENQVNHPVAFAKEVLSRHTNNSLVASAFLHIDFTKNLAFKSIAGITYFNGIKDVYYPRSTWLGNSEDGRAAIGTLDHNIYLNENYLTWNVKPFKDHSLSIVAGNSWQMTDSRRITNVISTFPNDILQNELLQSGALIRAPITGHEKYGLLSAYTRVNYNILNRYLITFTGRSDGSTKFGQNQKWATFYSFALGWKITDEPFIKKRIHQTEAKLRLSYGTSGNQAIKPYQTMGRLGTVGYYLDGKYQVGFGPGDYTYGEGYTGLANPDLTWETTLQSNLGMDLSFLKGRITIVADYYYKKTDNLLQQFELPKETGFTKALRNCGVIENRGFEVEANGYLVDSDFKWNLSLNYSRNRNKIVDLGGNNDVLGPKLSVDGTFPYSGHIMKVGEPLGLFYGYKTDGIIQTVQEGIDSKLTGYMAEPGEIKYLNLDGDSDVDGDDREVIGNANPDFSFGITNRFSYKNFELSCFFQGVVGNDVMNLNLRLIESVSGVYNQSQRVLDRWTPDNPSMTMPKAKIGRSFWMSDRYIQDGSYVRLKELKLSYQFPTRKTGAIRMARIFLSGSNLLTFTNYFGYDPEVNAFSTSNLTPGVDSGNYPNCRVYTLGVDISF